MEELIARDGLSRLTIHIGITIKLPIKCAVHKLMKNTLVLLTSDFVLLAMYIKKMFAVDERTVTVASKTSLVNNPGNQLMTSTFFISSHSEQYDSVSTVTLFIFKYNMMK